MGVTVRGQMTTQASRENRGRWFESSLQGGYRRERGVMEGRKVWGKKKRYRHRMDKNQTKKGAVGGSFRIRGDWAENFDNPAKVPKL